MHEIDLTSSFQVINNQSLPGVKLLFLGFFKNSV